MNDVLTNDERRHLDEMYFGPGSKTLAIIDRLVAEVERLRARNDALDAIAAKARQIVLKGYGKAREEFCGAEFRGMYDALAALDLSDATAAISALNTPTSSDGSGGGA